MATAIVNVGTSPQTLFTVPTNMKGKPSEIDIDNEGSSGPITIQITDTFTPSPSQAHPSPSPVTPIVRFQATIAQNSSFSADKNSCEDIEFLGLVEVVASPTDAGCAVIMGYHLD